MQPFSARTARNMSSRAGSGVLLPCMLGVVVAASCLSIWEDRSSDVHDQSGAHPTETIDRPRSDAAVAIEPGHTSRHPVAETELPVATAAEPATEAQEPREDVGVTLGEMLSELATLNEKYHTEVVRAAKQHEALGWYEEVKLREDGKFVSRPEDFVDVVHYRSTSQGNVHRITLPRASFSELYDTRERIQQLHRLVSFRKACGEAGYIESPPPILRER